jgi:hypothetical protein
MSGGKIVVWNESGTRWTWLYRSDEGSFRSNKSYADPDAAASAARVAYPDVDIESDDPRPPGAEASSKKGPWRLLTFILVLLRWMRER